MVPALGNTNRSNYNTNWERFLLTYSQVCKIPMTIVWGRSKRMWLLFRFSVFSLFFSCQLKRRIFAIFTLFKNTLIDGSHTDTTRIQTDRQTTACLRRDPAEVSISYKTATLFGSQSIKCIYKFLIKRIVASGANRIQPFICVIRSVNLVRFDFLPWNNVLGTIQFHTKSRQKIAIYKNATIFYLA